tara:strand:+ start:881 stop:1315 length:435 start_codon:yes stop_codon:yes gene_type:complete
MKKLLTPITILLLLACQPSELDRCIEANNNFKDRWSSVYPNGYDGTCGTIGCKDYGDFWNESEREIADAAQAYRIEYYRKNFPYIIDGVVQLDDEGKRVIDVPTIEKDFDDYAFMEESRALFVPKIESNFKAKATNFCNAQGIY